MRTGMLTAGAMLVFGTIAAAGPIERSGTLGIAHFGDLAPTAAVWPDTGGWYVIAQADFNGDGHADLAAIRDDATRIGVVLSSPTGYDPAVMVDLCDCFGAGEPPTAIGDTDGDGVLELLIADRAGRRVWAIPFSDGDFGAGRWISTGDVAPAAFAFKVLPDIDADGRDDLVFRQTSPTLAWATLPSASPGTVATRPFQSYAGNELLADLTGDGVPDAVTIAPGLVRIYPGGADGFGPAVEIPVSAGSVSVLDLDGDGAPDLIGHDDATEGWIRRNEGQGAFGPERRFAAPLPFTGLEAVGDLNANGIPDAVAFMKPPGFVISLRHVWLDPWLGAGLDRAGMVNQQGPARPTARDLDADGRPDLVMMAFDSMTALMNRGDATPIVGTRVTALNVDALDVRAADFDADGTPELIVCDRDGLSLWRRRADGSYAGETLATGDGMRFMSIPADLNGDGHADLVAVGANGFEIWPGSAAGLVAPPTRHAFEGPSTLWQAALGDVTGDGVPDLVAADIDAGLVRVLSGVEGGWPISEGSFQLAGAQAVALMDLDGDGVAEVLASGEAPSIHAFRRGPDGWEQVAETPMPRRPYWLTAGDLDGDGRTDLAVAFGTDMSTPVHLLYGGPKGLSAPVPVDASLTGSGQSEIAIGDVNGDGRLDLIVAPFQSNPMRPMARVLLQTEPRVFVNAGQIPGVAAGGVTLADADADGVTDVIGVCDVGSTKLLQIHSGRALPCPADLDGDGLATIFDLTAYAGLFQAGDPAADVAAPFGVLDVFDLLAFLEAYLAGCP